MDIRAFVHCKLRYSFEGVSHELFRGQNILVNYLLIEKDILRGPSIYPTINTGKSITNSRKQNWSWDFTGKVGLGSLGLEQKKNENGSGVFGDKSWEMKLGQNLGWEMGYIPPRTLN